MVALPSARLVCNMVALRVSLHSARLASRPPLAAPCPRAALRARSCRARSRCNRCNRRSPPHRRVADEALQFRRGARQDFGRGAASLCWLPAVPILLAPL